MTSFFPIGRETCETCRWDRINPSRLMITPDAPDSKWAFARISAAVLGVTFTATTAGSDFRIAPWARVSNARSSAMEGGDDAGNGIADSAPRASESPSARMTSIGVSDLAAEWGYISGRPPTGYLPDVPGKVTSARLIGYVSHSVHRGVLLPKWSHIGAGITST